MKRVISFLICLCFSFCLFACTIGGNESGESSLVPVESGENSEMSKQDSAGGKTPAEPFAANYVQTDEYMLVQMNRLPSSAADLEDIDWDEPNVVAAVIIAVLCYYETDPEACFEMMDALMGPQELSAYDKSFIKEQFKQYPYVARSYMSGATPENDYNVDTISFKLTETPYSWDEDGYVKLYLQSGGADSPRGVTLRHKESTDQWFLFSDSYKGLISGIRAPKSDDPWA